MRVEKKMMKAAVLPEKGKLELTDREIPDIGEGEALVEVKYAGICGSDVHVWQGHHATATYPRIPGHEFSGILVGAKGKLRDGLEIGDAVTVQPFWSCGMCGACITGHDNVCNELKVFGFHEDGCFAQYIRVPVRKVYRLPDQIPLKLGALTEPLAVAVHDVCRSGLGIGQNALVIGGGPIGLLIALVAKHTGAANVFISEINEFRIEFARSLGIDTINPAKEDLMHKTKEITRGNGFDVVFEVSGSRAGIENMTKLVKTKGTIMLVGISSQNTPIDTGAVFAKELDLKGVRLHSQEHFEAAIRMLEKGSINEALNRLVTREFPLDECVRAMEYQWNDERHFKVMMKA